MSFDLSISAGADGRRAYGRLTRALSQTADAWREARVSGDWRAATLQLNGLNMSEMLACLAELDGPARTAQREAVENAAGEINAPRIRWALEVVEMRLIPATAPGDLASTGQVQDGANWIAAVFLEVAREKNADATEHLARLVLECSAQGVGDPSHVAYVLASAHHESNMGSAMTEFASGDAYENRSDLGNTEPGDGRRFKGRGYVQITGRNHYTRYTARLRDVGIEADLVAEPARAAEPAIAAWICVHGMAGGTFTGRRLSQYGADGSYDFVRARAIVNGRDRAELIAGYARRYRALMGTRATGRLGRCVIDAGHGGVEPLGKSSPYGHRSPHGLVEKDVVLALANGVARLLGPGTALTRTGDYNVPLAARLAAGAGADAFVSLHAAPPGAGSTVWVHPRAAGDARVLGQAIASGLPRGCMRCDESIAVLDPDRLLGAQAVMVEVDMEEVRVAGVGQIARAIADGMGRALGAGRAVPRRAYGGTVRFQSGEELTITTGATGQDEEHWDPTGANLPLLDVSGSEGDKLLSDHFKAKEFGRSGGTRATVIRIDPRLVECLEALRVGLGQGVTISSGYRSWAYNKQIYESRGQRPTRSQHCAGRAADITSRGMSGLDIAKRALEICGCDISIGLAATYAHIDVRGTSYLWTYASYANGEADLAELREFRRRLCSARSQSLSVPELAEHDGDVGETDAARTDDQRTGFTPT